MKFHKPFMLLAIFFYTLTADASGNEIGIATGINSSFYKQWFDSNSEYAKSHDLINPVEVYFKKQILKYFALYSSVQFIKKSFSDWYYRTDIAGNILDKIEYGFSRNYISIQTMPLFYYKLDRFSMDIGGGLSGDIYINQNQTDFFTESKAVFREKGVSPFTLSFLSGAGVRYSLNNFLCLGLNTRVIRTLTKLYHNQPDNRTYFVNFQNTVSVGICF